MKKYLLILLLCFVVFKINYAQKFEFLKGVNSTSVEGGCIKTDKNGNIICGGNFYSSINYEGTQLNLIGQQDLFLSKYDSNGNISWVKSAGSVLGITIINSIDLDDSGNVYVSGLHSTSITFGLTTLNDSGVFVVKYSSSGNIMWANQIKGPLAFGPLVVNGFNTPTMQLVVSKYNELFIVGQYLDSVQIDTSTFYALGFRSFFLVKYDGNGIFKWARTAQSANGLYGFSLDLDSIGNPVVSGSFLLSPITFDSIVLNPIVGSTGEDLFIAKYDRSGVIQWAKAYGSPSSFASEEISFNNLVINGTGDIYTVVRLNPPAFGNFEGVYIAKFDFSGNLLWITDTINYAPKIFPFQITCDKYGFIYLAGSVYDTTNFFGTKINVNNPNEKAFIAKFDSSGKMLWIRTNSTDSIAGGRVYGLFVDYQLQVFSIGAAYNFSISAAYNSIAFENLLAPGSLFILKISQIGIGVADSIVITNYNSVNDTAFKDNRTTSILADTNGIIYSGSISGGLVVYDGAIWRSYNTLNSTIPSDSISNLFLDDSNQVWICTYDSGLVKFDTLNWKSFNTSNSGMPTNHITCGEWRNDTIFLGTELDDVVITDGVVWFDSYTNVYPGIPHDGVNSIKEDHNGNLWIATNDSGLVGVGSSGVTVYNYSNSGLPANTVQCLYVDANNTLWLGTDSNGLASFDGTNWRMFNSHNTTLPDNNIQSIVSGPSGKILVGTQSKGVGVFDGYTWELINDIIGLPDSNVTSIIFSDSVYWAGMHDMGVVKFALPNDTAAIDSLLHKTATSLLCYPNPFTSRIVVSYSLEKISDTKIKMFDVLGKLVAERRINNQMPGKYELAINDISLPEGLYFLQLLTDKGKQTAKVVVVH